MIISAFDPGSGGLMFFTFPAVLFALLLTGSGSDSPAEMRADPGFLVGIYGDENRSVTCVTGPAGATFEQVAWAYVPNALGLASVTLRFDFPANVERSTRPVFHDLVTQVIYTDFADGTDEWNMLFVDCPSGWIQVFSQECVLLDDQPSAIQILGDHSLARDCPFVLHDVEVVNQLALNDPDCPNVPSAALTWGRLKSVYR